MTTLLIIVAVLVFLDIISGIYLIGKKRPIVTAGGAILNTIIGAFMIIVVISAAIHL